MFIDGQIAAIGLTTLRFNVEGEGEAARRVDTHLE